MEEQDKYRVDLEGPCRCPGGPHGGGDYVRVYERVPVELGSAVIVAGREAEGDPVVAEGLMSKAFLRFGVESWNLVDEDGYPQSINAETLAALPFVDAYAIADRVAVLHSGEILRPLLGRTSTSSPGGRTDGSTSPTPSGSAKPRKASSPSSPIESDGKPSEAPED